MFEGAKKSGRARLADLKEALVGARSSAGFVRPSIGTRIDALLAVDGHAERREAALLRKVFGIEDVKPKARRRGRPEVVETQGEEKA